MSTAIPNQQHADYSIFAGNPAGDLPSMVYQIDLPAALKACQQAESCLQKNDLNGCEQFAIDALQHRPACDLAYRILNQDYKILYDPRFSLHHHKHSSGRLRSNEKWMRSYSNKLKLAFKNLPFRHVCAVASLWFFYSAFKARSLKVPFIAIQDFLVWKKLNNTKRLPIGKDALQYIKNCGGRSFV